MDFNSLRDQVSNLTLYDLKAGVRKVQNAVMNYTEMEAKVREATNNEPWGASSTLMQEIANGTYSYQLLNEIMPMVYKRFTEKSAEEWRQIYKSLQLLEFLIKNGSERVIDDARSHLSLLKMLRQFHYLDPNGKDQGINVRNRAQELAALLGDVERIRAERKKARANRNKFGGVEGGGGLGASMGGGGGSGMAGGSRYGGFGSEDVGYGGYSGGTYGDGGGFGGASAGGGGGGGFRDGARREQFEEYDEGDDPSSVVQHAQADTSKAVGKRKSVEAKKAQPEVDLFDFGDEPTPASAASSNGRQPIATPATATDDDDFDDFISAEPSSGAAIAPPPAATANVTAATPLAAPKPVSGANISGLAAMTTMSPAPPSASATPASSTFSSPPTLTQTTFNPSTQPPAQAPRPTGYQAAQPNYFTSVLANNGASAVGNGAASAAGAGVGAAAVGARPGLASVGSTGSGVKPGGASKASGGGGGDAFSGLWSSTSASAGIKKAGPAQGPNLASLAKDKAAAGIWGPAGGATQARPAGQQPQQPGAAAASRPAAPQQAGGGPDDLLG